MDGRWRGWLVAGGVALAAISDLAVALRPDGGPFAPEALAAARARLEALAKPGDLRVSSPLFRVGELAALGELAGTPHVPTPATLAARRVVVLDRRDHPIFGLGVAREVQVIPEGGGVLEIRVFEPEHGTELVRVGLLESLSASTMRVERPLGTVTSRCTSPRSEGGFGCPNEAEWLYAAARTLRIGGEDRTCVWAHPTTGGAVVLALPPEEPAPPGRRLVVEVSAGLVDDAVTGTPDGAAVRTEVVESGIVRGTVTVPNRIGWEKGRFSVDPGSPIELRITTPRDGRRHHCVNAEILEVEATSEGRAP